MKKVLRFLIVMLLTVIIISTMMTVFAAASKGTVTGDCVYVRNKATTENSDIITSLSKNSVVTVNSTKTGQEAVAGGGTTWYNITYNGITGYVYGKYIKLIEEKKTETKSDNKTETKTDNKTETKADNKTETTVNTEKYDFDKQILKFPKSYRKALTAIHKEYPNWIFVPDKLKISLDDAIDLEYSESLLSGNRKWVELAYGGDWRDPRVDINKSENILESRWTYASRDAMGFFMDPRNALVIENKEPSYPNIFTFLQQSYDPSIQTKAGLKTILAGTFMEKGYGGDKNAYVIAIMEAAKKSGVSPYVIAATIKIEQGIKGNSSLISGKYKGYEKYYNYFNYGASGSNVVLNGLKFAKKKGWNTRKASIIGGAKLYASGYINEGQDTYYYMDFNVKFPEKIWHQYAAALYDQCTKAVSIRSICTANKSGALTFKIPVYTSMPLYAYTVPKKHTCVGKLHNAKTATCKAEGYTGDSYCKICGKLLKKGKVIKITGHIPGEPQNAKAVTCTTNGYTGDKYCKFCNKLLSKGKVIKAKGHIIGSIKNAKAPTCIVNGYSGDQYCKTCNNIIVSGKIIKPLGHRYGEWIIDIPATKGAAGKRHRSCTTCGAVELSEIPAR